MKQLTAHEFLARGKMLRDDISIPVTIRGTFHRFEPNPVECTIMPEAHNLPSGPFSIEDDSVQFRGKTDDGDDIWISRISGATTSYSGPQITWKGTANLFIKGHLEEFDASGGQIICTVFIPPTALAITDAFYMPSYDGTITLDERSNREGIKWVTPLGPAELIDNYEYADEKVGQDKAIVRIRRCQIVIHVQNTGKTSLENLLKSLTDILDEPLWLGSFLSRKRIAWYSAEAVFIPDQGENQNFRNAIVHRQSWLGFDNPSASDVSWIDLLIHPRELRKGLFQQLLKNYEASPHKALIRRTIPYILMSYERGYFEAHIGNTYSALESLVAGLSPDEDEEVGFLLKTNEFKHLTSKIKQIISDEVGNKRLAQGIIKKLGELNRRSFLDRLMFLIKRYDVPVNKLWPVGSNIESELRDILKRRNLYIHQGRIDDIDQYFYDFARLKNLVELWILKLLRCPDDIISDVGLRRLAPIN